MKKLLLLAISSLFFAATAQAQIKPCDELKKEIHDKITNNGVPSFELKIVANADSKQEGWKVVGSCEGGTKKILYKRG